MLSHVTVGTSDFPRAFSFYAPLMDRLGWELRFRDDDRPWAVWAGAGGKRPFVILMAPHDGKPASRGNGSMVALLATDCAAVADTHALALSLGGADQGAPGLRPEYHAECYGAYFTDLDGNKLCVCTHG